MIENQLADRMRAAVADEPPLGFDPDEMADRAGRVRRRRRSTFAAAGATGAVLAIAVTAVVMTGAGGPGRDVGTQVATTPTRPDAACTSVEPGTVPPLHFPGSDQIVARLDEAAPRVIAKHLPGAAGLHLSSDGMIAYDCPPNVGTAYRVNGTDQIVVVYLVHARGSLDLANDQYAGDPAYQLLAEEHAPDARFRIYGSSGDGAKSGGQAGTGLFVVRFGVDGMVTEASLTGTGPLVAGRVELEALASDPELRF